LESIPEINYCGNILSIYEQSDPFGVSALERKKSSSYKIKHFGSSLIQLLYVYLDYEHR